MSVLKPPQPMSYLIPHLGSLLEKGLMRKIVELALMAAHIVLAVTLTYLLTTWLDILISATISASLSGLSYYLLRRILL